MAVLAFEVAHGEVESIERRYRAKHPGLLVNPATPSTQTYSDDGFKILDVFAYYKGEVSVDSSPSMSLFLSRFDARCLCSCGARDPGSRVYGFLRVPVFDSRPLRPQTPKTTVSRLPGHVS